jgi:predicted ester cyclase
LNEQRQSLIEANKQVVRNFFERAWNLGDDAAIDEYIAEGAGGNDPDFGAGREGFRRQWIEWRFAFPDLHFQIVDLIAERDYVLCRWILTGTHTNEFQGIAPTGKQIRVEGMSLERIGNGQIIDGFDGWDNLGFRRQLGALDPVQ